MNIVNLYKQRKLKKELKDFKKHLKHLLHVNDDILADNTKEKLNKLLEESNDVDNENYSEITEFTKSAPLRATKILPRKTHPIIREYIDIFAVALTVAFGLRALYMQPFKIPTSSMQPTLFGIHYIADRKLPDGSKPIMAMPSLLQYCLYSTQTAKADIKKTGKLDVNSIAEYSNNIIFTWSQFSIGGNTYNLPGSFYNHVMRYCKMSEKFDQESMLQAGVINPTLNDYLNYMKPFNKGDELCNGWLSLGDHLFVDRFTFQFREPRRGDITVFNTEGLSCRNTGYFFIKRLIGMPGDTLKIIDNMVYVKEKGADKFKPITDFNIKAINKIYSGKGGYHGHLPEKRLAEGLEFKVPDDHYFMLGDNSSRSSDSRYWGPVPRENIVGRAFFVFWPLSRRWGITDRLPPVDVDTQDADAERMGLQPSMRFQ